MREDYLFRIIWGELYENDCYRQIFVSNYELSRFSKSPGKFI
jgi:hypothetical protein